MKKILFASMGVLGSVASALAVDVPITVTAPTFDWTVVGTVMAGMLLAAVGVATYRRVKGTIR